VENSIFLMFLWPSNFIKCIHGSNLSTCPYLSIIIDLLVKVDRIISAY